MYQTLVNLVQASEDFICGADPQYCEPSEDLERAIEDAKKVMDKHGIKYAEAGR